MEEDFSEWTGVERRINPRVNNIVIVRHAESIANTQGIYQGQTYDTDLSDLGKKQAKALADRLKHFGARKVITSSLKRTKQTAQAIADKLGCRVVINDRIIETDHGVWEGKHKDWIRENYSEGYEMWMNKPSMAIFPDGETFMDTVNRTLDFLENVELEENDIIITHDNIIRAMISLIKNEHIDKMWQIPLETAALNFFEFNKINNKNVYRILELNHIDHLKGLRNDIKVHAL